MRIKLLAQKKLITNILKDIRKNFKGCYFLKEKDSMGE